MTLSMIVAVAANQAIGFKNKLIYWLPNDLKQFKAITSGHTIIMGRNTFLSLPKGALPNRRNIVLSQTEKQFVGSEHFPSLDEALKRCKEEEEVFIIGGAMLYQEALKKADRLYVTHIHHTPEEADTFFPEIDPNIWEEKSRDDHPMDDKHLYPYSFVRYERRN
ncbi:MAG: dihydrofolate reductase [Phocaeicola sp.]